MKGSVTHLSLALALWIAGACQAATVSVRAGDDLAAAVRAAQPGDTAENAANASNLPLDRIRELLGQMGTGDGPLAGLGKMFG